MTALTHTPNLSHTCEASAAPKVHGLHANGKVQLPDIPCEKGKWKKKENEKMRNEGRAAAA
jgi:hypothetical protein